MTEREYWNKRASDLEAGRDSDRLSAYKHKWNSEIWHMPKVQFDLLKFLKSLI